MTRTTRCWIGGIGLLGLILVGGLAMATRSLWRPVARRVVRWMQGPAPVLVEPDRRADVNVLFLHHSTGARVWRGGLPAQVQALAGKQSGRIALRHQAFPKADPYGWHNDPYDYWWLWVAHAGPQAVQREPTLEMICQAYDVVVWKHCFPVSAIEPDQGQARPDCRQRRLEVYKAQYEALRDKMLTFTQTRFLVWTPPALVSGATTPEQNARAEAFAGWLRNDWDRPGDNIFLWDFRALQRAAEAEGPDAFAVSSTDSHPNEDFCRQVAPLLARRILGVIDGSADHQPLTGETDT